MARADFVLCCYTSEAVHVGFVSLLGHRIEFKVRLRRLTEGDSDGTLRKNHVTGHPVLRPKRQPTNETNRAVPQLQRGCR